MSGPYTLKLYKKSKFGLLYSVSQENHNVNILVGHHEYINIIILFTYACINSPWV